MYSRNISIYMLLFHTVRILLQSKFFLKLFESFFPIQILFNNFSRTHAKNNWKMFIFPFLVKIGSRFDKIRRNLIYYLVPLREL